MGWFFPLTVMCVYVSNEGPFLFCEIHQQDIIWHVVLWRLPVHTLHCWAISSQSLLPYRSGKKFHPRNHASFLDFFYSKQKFLTLPPGVCMPGHVAILKSSIFLCIAFFVPRCSSPQPQITQTTGSHSLTGSSCSVEWWRLNLGTCKCCRKLGPNKGGISAFLNKGSVIVRTSTNQISKWDRNGTESVYCSTLEPDWGFCTHTARPPARIYW